MEIKDLKKGGWYWIEYKEGSSQNNYEGLGVFVGIASILDYSEGSLEFDLPIGETGIFDIKHVIREEAMPEELKTPEQKFVAELKKNVECWNYMGSNVINTDYSQGVQTGWSRAESEIKELLKKFGL